MKFETCETCAGNIVSLERINITVLLCADGMGIQVRVLMGRWKRRDGNGDGEQRALVRRSERSNGRHSIVSIYIGYRRYREREGSMKI